MVDVMSVELTNWLISGVCMKGKEWLIVADDGDGDGDDVDIWWGH